MTRDATRRDVLRTVGAGALGSGLAATGAAGARNTVVSGRLDDPVEVTTVRELQAIRDDLAGDYLLVGDVDASGVEFEPLGSENEPFTGTLDGDGHAISGLTINGGDGQHVGLFAVVGSRDAETGGVVRNLSLRGVDVAGGVSVGGLAGANVGSLSDVTVSGSTAGERRVGGVVGAHGGCIWRSRAACSVNASSVAGGLVGRNGGYVAASSASGNVAGEGTIGGLVGEDTSGVVTRSSAAGDVTGTVRVSTNVGGLVGALGGRVLGSTAEGSVSGYDAVGGLVGYGGGGSVVLTSTAAGSGPLVGDSNGDVVSADHPSLGGNARTAWWFQTYTGDRVSASPTVVNGTVHVGTFDGLGACEPDVYAVDAATGDEVWKLGTEANGTRTAGRHRQNSYVRTSAANVVDGTAYVKVPGRGVVLAIDAETGQERWRGEMEWEGHPGSPTRYGDTVFANDGEWLYWFDAATGEWDQRRRTEDPGASVTVADGRVYAYDRNDGLRAWDTRSGDEEWTFGGLETPTRHSAPTVAGVPAGGGGASDGGTVYATDREGVLRAVDAATGDPEWSFEMRLDGSVDSPRTTPTVARVPAGDSSGGGTVFVGSRSGRVYAVDAATGEQRWTYTVEPSSSVHASPTVVDRTVFFGSDDEHLYALDATTGEENWRFEARGAVRSAPVVVDGVVYFGTTSGFVYALDADVDGSSEDSRVALGTLGHHDTWTRQDDVPRGTRTPETTRTSTGSAGGSGMTDSAPTDTPDGDYTWTTDGNGRTDESGGTDGGDGGDDAVQVPGPGVVGAIGSVLGAGYLLGRRSRDDAQKDGLD